MPILKFHIWKQIRFDLTVIVISPLEKGFTELNDEFEDIIVKTRRSLSVDSIIRPVTAHSVKKQRSFSIISSEDWPKTAQSEDNTAILNSKYALNLFKICLTKKNRRALAPCACRSLA